MPVHSEASKAASWYGYPPWAVFNLAQVQSTSPLSKESGLKAIERVHEVNMIKSAHPHLGRNFDRYA